MKALALTLVGAVLAWDAQGAPFADPTRPPRAMDGDATSIPSGGTRLQSVLIAPDRRVAVIGGQQVTLGSRIGNGEVVRITESEVVIRRPDGEETLKLFPRDGVRPAAPGQGR